ncbi:hypothetical protein EV421DRAFT_1735883 [Armillaria borealis]|uniref:Peptidase C14 caspase domain-containing protein n=1 Tax=Armillaria borealis TaxID=47425 RepID=A0AA39JIW3_9AGAR|nr:hypothetical protein EV421DRAFT_1735883 [Armillaria borealis]
MVKFLTEDLGVPNDHIQCLLGASSQSWPTLVNIILSVYHYFVPTKPTPTRINIIDTLLNLSMKPEIQYDDNIIIYFAGHASSYKCSDYHIEGGNTRGPMNVQRGAVPLPPSATKNMLEHAHTRLRDLPKYHSVFDGDWKPDMSSHVLLAACKDYETAKEGWGTGSHWNGIFTRALIEVLKSDKLMEGSTYADLIHAVKENMSQNTTQTPVVAGNADARLWYQPQMSKQFSSWSAMQVWLLSVVGIGHTRSYEIKLLLTAPGLYFLYNSCKFLIQQTYYDTTPFCETYDANSIGPDRVLQLPGQHNTVTPGPVRISRAKK